ncbi:accessory gland protein Acp32CD [Drosophila hydei]|uniref:Accessory gland protein Acp32CD n=1 Tax=Drosophila hydei TaxID=7224 RepID=A0A6J1LFZ9_DROHY|nr:accessory gland protein Acp32CD [Drosophila hydei]
MRTRLSIRILALGLLLWQLQATAVRAQKYYMNFAFNNNNPNGGLGDETSEDQTDDPSDGVSGDHDGSGADHNGGSDSGDNDHNSSSGAGGGSGSGSDDGSSGGSGSGSDSGSGGGSSASGGGRPGSDSGTKADVTAEPFFMDNDDDDSDSHDMVDRRTKMKEAEANGNRPENDHSHHSSYEISIDDSFGGRYVRSIYESSESHGHSGSNPDSGPRQTKQGESSDASEYSGKLYNEDDYEEDNTDES